MVWIELHQSLRYHAKTGRLAFFLKIKDPDHSRAKLENLWLWAIDNCLDGKLKVADRPLSAEEIAFASGWNGDPTVWLRSLIDAGWIDEAKGGVNGKTLQLHDWHDYAGKLIDSRKADAKRKRDARKRGRPADGRSDGGRTVPNRTVPNPTQPGDGEAAPTPILAPPATPDSEREIDQTVGAFGFCNTPGIPAKRSQIRDLLRLGITHEQIRSVAARQDKKTFIEIIRSLEKDRSKIVLTPKTAIPKKCRNPKCIDGKIIDHAATTPEKTAFKPCPDCGPPAEAKATG